MKGGEREGTREAVYTQTIPTIFVDNLPYQIRKIWLYNLFSRYGKIRSIFIPSKRSKISGQSFGFVRFYSHKDANLAVEETSNGWYWGHKLVVKFARFLRKDNIQGPQESLIRGHAIRSGIRKKNPQKVSTNFQKEHRGREVWRRKGIPESSKQGEERNLKAVDSHAKGTLQDPILKPSSKGNVCIPIQPVGNGWLCRSAVAKIRKLLSGENLELVFRKEGVQDIQIKAMGGRFLIIIFPNVEARDSIIKEKWICNWFEEIKPWNGEQAKIERFVWLSCVGMPLNAWSIPTFEKIGNCWGKFLQVDESTLKEQSFDKGNILIVTEQPQRIMGNVELLVDGAKFVVTVEEEATFRTIKQNKLPSTDLPVIKDRMCTIEEDDEKDQTTIENQADLAVKKDDKAAYVEVELANAGLVKTVGEQIINEPAFSSTSGAVSSTRGSEEVMDTFETNLINKELINSKVQHDSCNNVLGFMESNDASTMVKDINEGNQIEGLMITEVNQVEEGLEVNQGEDGHQLDILEENQVPIQAAIKGVKGKKKKKTIDEILGLSKANLCDRKGGRNKSKCVVLRSAVAAAALSASVSTEGISNRNKILLNEAQTIWAVNKIMGIGYNGEEEEVISKIAESLEAQNKERATC